MKLRFNNWNALRRLLVHARDTLRQQRLAIAGSFFALFLETLFRLAEPWPLQYVVDNLLLPFANSGNKNLDNILFPLLIASLILLAIIGLRAFAAYIWTIGFAVTGNRLLLSIRAKAFSHLQLLSLRFHGTSRSGDLLMRLIDDVGMVRDVVVTAALPLLGNMVLLLTMLLVMAWLSWQLTLTVLAGAPMLWLLSRQKSKSIHKAAKEQRRQVSKIAATAAESLSSIRAVQALGLGNKLAESFQSASNRDLHSGVKVKRLSASMERLVDLMIGIITAAVLFVGVLEVFAARLSTGELLVFLAYLRSTAVPVRNWAKFTARIAKSNSGAERILEILEEVPDVVEAADAKIIDHAKGHIEFRNLSFSYDSGKSVFNNINLVIQPGESIALIGESGAGKSTLLALAMRLYDPDQGEILLDGENIKSLTLESLRNQYSVALQDALLFHGSIRANIAQGLPDASNTEIEAAAKISLVTEFTEQWPEGLDTQIGERGAKISNGQKQRISLARAILKNAPILIVDEPLTGLDPETAKAVDNVLHNFAKSRTFILITHNLEQAARTKRIITIKNKTLVEARHPIIAEATV